MGEVDNYAGVGGLIQALISDVKGKDGFLTTFFPQKINERERERERRVTE